MPLHLAKTFFSPFVIYAAFYALQIVLKSTYQHTFIELLKYYLILAMLTSFCAESNNCSSPMFAKYSLLSWSCGISGISVTCKLLYEDDFALSLYTAYNILEIFASNPYLKILSIAKFENCLHSPLN